MSRLLWLLLLSLAINVSCGSKKDDDDAPGTEDYFEYLEDREFPGIKHKVKKITYVNVDDEEQATYEYSYNAAGKVEEVVYSTLAGGSELAKLNHNTTTVNTYGADGKIESTIEYSDEEKETKARELTYTYKNGILSELETKTYTNDKVTRTATQTFDDYRRESVRTPLAPSLFAPYNQTT